MWCKRCKNGSEDYKAQKCGNCGGIELVSENPFAESRKHPRSIRAMWKRVKQDNVKGVSKDAKKQVSEEVAEITKGKQSRDYTQLG